MRVKRIGCGCLALALLWSAKAAAKPPFHEGFESGTDPKPNFFVSGNGQWNLAANLVAPPPVPDDSTSWGWMPTFGENVSVARHAAMGEQIPGIMMNDIDPTDGVQSTQGGLWALGSVLGGDYWDSAYPIGVIGEYYLGTGDVRPSRRDPWNFFLGPNKQMTKDAADEALTFDAFTQPIAFQEKSQDFRFVSFLLGGLGVNGEQGPDVFVSVEMEPDTINGQPTGCTGKHLAPIPAGGGSNVALYWGEKGTYKSIKDKILHDNPDVPSSGSLVAPTHDERMRLVVLDLWGQEFGPKGLNPRSTWCPNGRIRIVDRSPRGHLNVDEVMVSNLDDLDAAYPSAPFGSLTTDRPKAVYGFAEVHSHWMSNMGNGGQPLTTVTDPADRKSLRGLMTAMGAMSGLPYQPSDSRIYDICHGTQLGPNHAVSDFCPAVGANGQGGPGTAATSCDPATGSCVVDAGQREALALAACDGEYHAARSTYPDDDFTGYDTSFYEDHYYRPQEASATLLQGLAPNDGNKHLRKVGVIKTQDAFHGVTGFDAAKGRFLYPARPFMGKVHQQMYWTWLKRAWRGGLRLMVTDVVHSIPLDVLLNEWWAIPIGSIGDPGPDPLEHQDMLYGHAADEQLAIQRQTCAVKKLVGTAPEISSWASVVYSPLEARQVIARGRLAIVLGAEIDSAGALRAGLGQADPVASELDFVTALGVRKVTPIHQVDNRLGGPALFNPTLTIYNDTLNIANDALEGGNCISAVNWDRKFDPGQSKTHWYLNQILFEDALPMNPDKHTSNWFPDNYAHLGPGQLACTFAYNPYRAKPGADWCFHGDPDCYPDFHLFDLDLNPTQIAGDELTFSMADAWMSLPFDGRFVRPQIEYHPGYIGRLQGYVANFDAGPVTPSSPFQNYPMLVGLPSINMRPLQSLGEEYVRKMMERGLLLDIEHMGEHSRDRVFQIVWGTGTDGLPCDDEKRHMLAACQANAYPVIATHSQLRWPQSKLPLLNDERSWRRDEVTQIMQTGGLVGINTGYDFIESADQPAESGHELGKQNDCPGSSKAFAQHYLAYVAQGEASGPLVYDFGGAGAARPPHWASRGGAVGSDFNGFATHVGSRYNPWANNNCYGLNDFAFDMAIDPNQLFANDAQIFAADGVFYDQTNDFFAQSSQSPGAGLWPQPPLQQLVPSNGAKIEVQPVSADGELAGGGFGSAFYDYNQMGLAHIGLLPDLLQDSVNPMRRDLGTFTEMQYQMRYLWRSAEDFIEAWEKSVAVCKATGSSQCEPPAPNDAATCDLWASDLDAGGQMFDLYGKAGLPNMEANQPSCMARCGQELDYTEYSWSDDPQPQLVPHQATCRCWIHADGGDAWGKEYDSPPGKYTLGGQTFKTPICNDFKQWCQHAYNYSPDEGYLDWSSP